MSEPFVATKVTDHVYWVGAIDWGLREFHGYATERGTTYNAYLIISDKITLVDTVRAPFFDEMMSRISSVIDPSKIDYIVSNHSEMDHSGCLPQTIERCRPEKVFVTANGAKALKAHFHKYLKDYEFAIVEDGQTQSLGDVTLSFVETRMLHWPDSMFTYLVEEKLLFSQDGFGMHLASGERFADEIDTGVLEYEAAKYYANILLPFSIMVKNTIEKASGIDIAIIAPDHGPIWRKNVGRIVELYASWAAQKPAKKAVIVYDTMWGATESMARAIEDGLLQEGVCVRTMGMHNCHRSNVATEYLDAAALIVGSPTINNGLFPSIAETLCYLKGLKRKNVIGAAFGAYGWSGEAVAQISESLAAMKIETAYDPIKVLYVPDNDALSACREMGVAIGRMIQERAARS